MEFVRFVDLMLTLSLNKSGKYRGRFGTNILKCLSTGTPKTINFPFVPNGKFMVFRCPNIWAYYDI